MLSIKKPLIFLLLAFLPLPVIANQNPAMAPVISYLLSGKSIELCPAGSDIIAMDTDAGIARVGSVFSTTQYNPNIKDRTNRTHNPKELVLKVIDASGVAIEGCRVYFNETDGNGWVYPDSQKTQKDGTIKAWWVAGANLNQSVDATIVTKNNISKKVTFNGIAEPHITRANSIHINYDVGATYDRFKVDITPITFPQTTYYSAINFPGGYCGIQNRNHGNKPQKPSDKWIIFSVWDTANVDAEIIYHNSITTCQGFGGEGTGAKCNIEYDWEIGGTYRFELEVTYPVASRTDYTLYFTDVDKPEQQAIKIATLRYGQYTKPYAASGFVEDWSSKASSCLETNTHAAYFHNIKHKLGSGNWQDVTSANPSAVYNQWHNEICKNYYFGKKGRKFLWSTGGDTYLGQPFVGSARPAKVTLD